MLTDANAATRRLNLAEWHVRESRLRDAAGDFDAAAGHLADAAEYMQLASGREPRGDTADEMTAEIEMLRDQL